MNQDNVLKTEVDTQIEPQREDSSTQEPSHPKSKLILIGILTFFILAIILILLTTVKTKQVNKLATKSTPVEENVTPTPTPGTPNVKNDPINREYMESIMSLHDKYQTQKNCDLMGGSVSTTLIAMLKSKSNPGGGPTPEHNVWISDENGCNQEIIPNINDVCKIFEFSPNSRYLLVAQCNENSETSGNTYSKISVIDIKTKKINNLVNLNKGLNHTLGAWWVDDSDFWYLYYEPFYNSELEAIQDQLFENGIVNGNPRPDYDQIVADYYKPKGEAWIYKVNINGNSSPLVYPYATLKNRSSSTEVVPSQKKMFILDNGFVKQYDLSSNDVSHIPELDIKLQNSTGDKYSFYTVLDNSILFRSGGQLFTTDFEGKNRNVYITTDSDTEVLNTLYSQGSKALYPVNDCWVPDTKDTTAFTGRQLGFYSKSGIVKTFFSNELIFANGLNAMLLDANNKELRFVLCNDYYILDTSKTEIEVLGTVCGKDEWCHDAVTN